MHCILHMSIDACWKGCTHAVLQTYRFFDISVCNACKDLAKQLVKYRSLPAMSVVKDRHAWKQP